MELYHYVTNMYRPLKWAILLCMDVFWVPVALLTAFALQKNSLNIMDFPLVNTFATIVLMGICVLLSIVTKTYRIQLKSYERRAVALTAIQTFALCIFAFALDRLANYGSDFSVFLIFGLSYFMLVVSSRVVLLQILQFIHRQLSQQTRVLIYGAGATGRQLVAALRTDESVIPVGFVDDNKTLQGSIVQGLKVNSPKNIPDLAKRRNVNRVLLAMPSLSRTKLLQISTSLKNHDIDVQSLPSFAQLTAGQTLVDQLKPILPGQFLGREELNEEIAVGASVYTNRNILISGAGGSIGAELCKQLLSAMPAKLILCEISEHALFHINLELNALVKGKSTQIIPVLGSVTDAEHVKSTMRKYSVDVILHAAAYKHVPLVEENVLMGASNNIAATKVLADTAYHNQIERFILISTDKAVHPKNAMGASKYVSELIIRDLADNPDSKNSKTIFSMVRFGNVIGSSGSVIPLFQDQIKKGGPVTVTHLDVTRYFMTIPEATKLVLLAGALGKGNDLFILDMGKPVRIADLAAKMIVAAGYQVRDEDNPSGDIEIEIIGLRQGEKIEEELLFDGGTTTTPHKKIFLADEPQLDRRERRNLIDNIATAIASRDEVLLRNLLRALSPNAKDVIPFDSSSVREFSV